MRFRKHYMAWTAVMVSAACMAWGACETAGEPVVIPRFDKPPVIDGVITDGAWAASPRLELVEYSGKVLKNKTAIFMGHDAENLYIAFDCAEADMKNIRRAEQFSLPGPPAVSRRHLLL